jgi:tetratricopeptide (TPR) repeat protein
LVEATEAVRAEPDSAEAWGRLGTIYDIHRLGEQAIPCYDHATELEPDNWRWLYFSGLALRESDQQAALSKFARAAELQPDYPPLRFYLGYGHLLSEDLDAAEREFNEALRVDPRMTNAMIGLARVALARNEPARAVEILEAATRIAPREAAVHHNLAAAYRAAGDTELAEQQERLAGLSPMAMQPGNMGTLNDPVREESILQEGASTRWLLHNSSRMMAEGQPDRALQMLEQILADDPDSVVALLESSRILALQGELEQAQQRVEHALTIDPDSAKAHAEMAGIRARSGDVDGAIREFETAIELDPGLPEPRNNLAALLFEAGRRDEGLARLRDAAEELPDEPDVQYNYAAALAMSGRLEEAAETLRDSIERRPDSTASIYLLGSIEAMRGRYQDAVGYFGLVLQREPNHYEARMDIGRALWELDRYKEAIATFYDTLRIRPSDQAAARELAWALATCPDDSVRDGEQSLVLAEALDGQTQSRDPRILDVLAAAQAESGDFRAAVESINRAILIVERTIAARGASRPRETAGAKRLLAELRDRRELYEAGRAYRES